MRPGPKARRETRDANAEEATGEKQLLRLERPFQTAGPTYNVIQNARGFLTKQVMRCRARLTAPLGRAQPPLSTTPYRSQLSRTAAAVVPELLDSTTRNCWTETRSDAAAKSSPSKAKSESPRAKISKGFLMELSRDTNAVVSLAWAAFSPGKTSPPDPRPAAGGGGANTTQGKSIRRAGGEVAERGETAAVAAPPAIW